jgi:pyruvate/2-oxoglutarate dehydrogenase complex dihydrolipoamide acyltransferase (E2) component
MAEFIVMPKMGLTMTKGTLTNWRKKEGDLINKGDILFDVETDKLTNKIEAVIKAKPAAAKGKYLRSVTIASTMGPGIKLNTTKLTD